MKALFNKKKSLLKELNAVGFLLDKKIEERFGFHYSQTDNDEMIDSLDYGTQDLKYNRFIELMKRYGEKEKKENWTPNP
jgi:hypothetical protein